MSDLLFDVQWWIPGLIALIGLAAFWTGNRNLKKGRERVGLALIAVALVWGLMSYFVETDKEKVLKESRKLLKSVVDNDWAQFKSELAPDAAFRIETARPTASGPDEISDVAEAGAQTIRLKSASLSRPEVQQTGPLITVKTEIFSTQEYASEPSINSLFEFDWGQTSQGWKVREIRLMKIGPIDAREIADAVPHVRIK